MNFAKTLMLATTLLCSQHVMAQTLMQAFEESIKHDPNYKAAQANRKAGEAERKLSRASLLPQVSATLYEGRSENERTLLNTTAPRNDTTDFDVKNNSLTIQQPIYNPDGRARFAQGDLISKQTVAQEAEALGQLSLRVTGAYLEILSAIEQLRLAESETSALKERLALINSGIDAGEASRTDLAEAQAQLDLAEARLLESKEALSLRLRTLENTTGRKSSSILFPSVIDVAAMDPPLPFDKLRSRMMINSPTIINALFDIRIAEQELARQNAGHHPRLDFIARYSESESDTVNSIGQQNDQSTYALQMQIPIFSGFAVDASIEKALANLDLAKLRWQASVYENGYLLQEEYSKYSVSKIKIDAFKKAVDSSRISLKAAELGLKLGVRTLSDVLEAQRLLFSTEKDLSRVRYETLTALVRINAISGQLNIRTIRQISELLSKDAELVEFQRPDLMNIQLEDPKQFELLDFNGQFGKSEETTHSLDMAEGYDLKVLKKESINYNEVIYSLGEKPALSQPPAVQ